jgi:hypothetical protein
VNTKEIRRKKPDINEVDLLLTAIKQKPELNTLVKMVESNPKLIDVLLKIIKEDKGNTKFYCEKAIRKISETSQTLVYPYFNEISRLLDSTNNFVKWGAILTISNLISVDKENHFNSIYDKYFSMIDSDSMITASNVIDNAWKFVQALPKKENDITSRLLKVIENTYLHKKEPSPECKNIVIGNVIDCFSKYYENSGNQEKMLEFVGNQMKNGRKSTARKAVEFIKKHTKIY